MVVWFEYLQHYFSSTLQESIPILEPTLNYFTFNSQIYLLHVICEKRYGPGREISNNVVCATSKASDQPAHTRRLIRALASHLNIL